ncbi:glycosyltransferase family 4 protein, partial [Pseudanabaenaceae cyanobacterium LEGE 13415]|nr:glycosyltransferase family 4 protein [Pseudanabaenaceae cyanobacterium LEGE 13415]
MIIGHYTPHLTAHGGAERYLERIAIAQREMGHTVYYFSKYDDIASLHEIPVLSVTTDAEIYTKALQLNIDLLHLHGEVSLLPPSNLVAIRTVQGHQPYCPSGSKFLARSTCPCDRTFSVTGCLWGHFVDRCGSIRPHRLIQGFESTRNEQKVLSKVPTLANSSFVRERMIASGYSEQLVQTLYLAVPDVVDTTPPPQDDLPRFLFLGRLTAAKGVTWLLKAVKHVKTPIHLDIAGDGQQGEQLQLLVQHLEIQDRVTFHGWVNTETVYQLIQSSRALIFPSLWHEPAGMVAYEALINARAAIASRVGGIPEGIIDGANGLLVEPNDVSGLAHQIDRLATDWMLAKQYGEAGRRFAVEAFGIEHHMKRLMQIYQQQLANRTVLPVSYTQLRAHERARHLVCR